MILSYIGIVFCLVSQGPKGTYMTTLKVYGESKTHYLVRSDGWVLQEVSPVSMHLGKINKRLCKPMVKYDK